MSNSTPPSTTCPKCEAPMEFGLLIDATSRAASKITLGPEQVLQWVRGMPDRSWIDLSFKTGKGDRLQVATLRCTVCGFLELYAPEASSD